MRPFLSQYKNRIILAFIVIEVVNLIFVSHSSEFKLPVDFLAILFVLLYLVGVTYKEKDSHDDSHEG